MRHPRLWYARVAYRLTCNVGALIREAYTVDAINLGQTKDENRSTWALLSSLPNRPSLSQNGHPRSPQTSRTCNFFAWRSCLTSSQAYHRRSRESVMSWGPDGVNKKTPSLKTPTGPEVVRMIAVLCTVCKISLYCIGSSILSDPFSILLMPHILRPLVRTSPYLMPGNSRGFPENLHCNMLAGRRAASLYILGPTPWF